MAANALQLARGVASLLNTEYKYTDVNAAPTLGAYTSNCLNVLSQGNSAITRTGDSVKFTTLQLSAFLNAGVGAVNLARVMIFIYKAPRGSLPVSPLTVSSVISPLFPETANQYIILYDSTHKLSSSGDTVVLNFSLNIPLSFHTEYSGNAGTVADIQTNGIFIAYFDAVVVGAAHASINYYSRLQYIDN